MKGLDLSSCIIFFMKAISKSGTVSPESRIHIKKSSKSYIKAGTNEKTLLQKQNCVPDIKCFWTISETLFAFKAQICVFNTCCVRTQTRKHLGNIEETLTLNASRLFPRLLTQATYFEDAEFASRKQRMFCFLPVSSLMQHYEQH